MKTKLKNLYIVVLVALVLANVGIAIHLLVTNRFKLDADSRSAASNELRMR